MPIDLHHIVSAAPEKPPIEGCDEWAFLPFRVLRTDPDLRKRQLRGSDKSRDATNVKNVAHTGCHAITQR